MREWITNWIAINNYYKNICLWVWNKTEKSIYHRCAFFTAQHFYIKKSLIAHIFIVHHLLRTSFYSKILNFCCHLPGNFYISKWRMNAKRDGTGLKDRISQFLLIFINWRFLIILTMMLKCDRYGKRGFGILFPVNGNSKYLLNMWHPFGAS